MEESTLESLPRHVLARVGSFMDCRTRNACVLAAKWANGVHETASTHRICFAAAAPDKLAAAARIVRHVLALMPRLATLTVAFDGFAEASEDAEACARVLATVGVPVVRLDFTRCEPAFMRCLVWDRACTVALHAHLGAAWSLPKIEALLDVADAIEYLKIGARVCSHMTSATLDRIRNLTIAEASVLDLRHVNPQKTFVQITGVMLRSNVQGAHNIGSITSAAAFPDVRMRDAILRDGADHIQDVRLVVLPRESGAWTDIVNALPPASKVLLVVSHPGALPFLESLTGDRTVCLGVHDEASFVMARVVQLLLPQRTYELKYALAEDAPLPAPVHCLHDAYARLSAADQVAWYFVKYCVSRERPVNFNCKCK